MNELLPGTKIAERLFSRPEGATMAEVIATTGGRQHNLLERLKARGYSIRSAKEGRTTRYWAARPLAPIFPAQVTSKGQVTIPKEVRDRLRVPQGGKVHFVLDLDGRIRIGAGSGSISDLFGILGKPKRHLTLKQIKKGIIQGAIERAMRR